MPAREGWRLASSTPASSPIRTTCANPANRCFFCKTNLYGAIAARTDATICSGTNLDDLGDYRPGLQAAQRATACAIPMSRPASTRPPCARSRARLGLDDLAELPAAPCLSSRLETGIAVDRRAAAPGACGRAPDPATRWRRARALPPAPGRRRDPARRRRAWRGSRASRRGGSRARSRSCSPSTASRGAVRFEPYRMGSAFLDRRPHG